MIAASSLKQFRMGNALSAATLMDVHVKLDPVKYFNEWEADPAEYQATAGSLVYIAIATRPDVFFAVSA